MGRGRGGKGKKQTSIAFNDEAEKGKLSLPGERSGRPKKEAQDDQMGDGEEEDPKAKDRSTEVGIGEGRKRKKPTRENSDAAEDENESVGVKNSSDSNCSFVKSVGFRPNGSRRKNKPCRAAEVGVEC